MPDPGGALFGGILLLSGVALFLLVVGLLVWQATQARRKESPGFEVKPTTGETPVLREKENDHG